MSSMIALLREAVRNRREISFTYIKPGKTDGIRIGNPHALFIQVKKDGTKSTKVHIVQTAGVSDSDKPFPSFRMFDILDLGAINLTSEDGKFHVSSEYNPLWDGYAFVIDKV